MQPFLQIVVSEVLFLRAISILLSFNTNFYKFAPCKIN